jgi:hypothetical protein
MPLPSPSDLCWNVKFPPGQEWIEKTVRGAIETIWQRAQSTARAQFGDESLAVEIMEVAIQKAVNRLSTGAPVELGEACLVLSRFHAQEIRRRRYGNRKLVFLGSNAELPASPVQNQFSSVDSTIDLGVILHDIPLEVRLALLMRYSRTRWTEVAAILGTSEASIRVRCQRALKRIRQRLGVNEHGE